MNDRSRSLPAPSPGSLAARVWGHVRPTLGLALPVMVARSGMLTMITIDVVMTGHAGATELAYYGLAFAPMSVLYVMGLGVVTGAMVLSAQTVGVGYPERSATVWAVSLLAGLLLGLAYAVSFLGGEAFFLATGQAPDLAHGGAAVLGMFAWGMPPLLMHLATALFLDGISRPRANMVVTLAGNAANLLLNWLLIFDHAGWSGMGAQGAALATSLTRWLMFAAMAGFVFWMPDRRRFGVGESLRYPLDFARKFVRIGVPLGLAHGLESGAFTTLILFAGLLGAKHLAAYQIAQNLFSIVYMAAIGVGTASAVRVGNAVGRRDPAGTAWAGWTGLGVAGAMFVPPMLLFGTAPGFLARLYNGDPAVLALAVPAIGVGALFLFFDGSQGVLMGALRGAGDVWVPTFLVTGGFWGVSVPLAWYLCFVRGGAVVHIMWSLLGGGIAATAMLAWRFRRISARDISPL